MAKYLGPVAVVVAAMMNPAMPMRRVTEKWIERSGPALRRKGFLSEMRESTRETMVARI
jgi:hypothetical protein